MRNIRILLICLPLLAGCSGNDRQPAGRTTVHLGDIALLVRGGTRTYMQSDREGAFLTGVAGGAEDGDRWSLAGVELLGGVRVECAGEVLLPASLDSARILPTETVRYYRGGISVGISGIETGGGADVHGFVVRVTLPRPGAVKLHLSPAAGSIRNGAAHLWSWQCTGGETIVATAGNDCSPTQDGVALDASGVATFLVCSLPPGADRSVASLLYGRADSLLAARRTRMENLLNASYFRTSDDTLDGAVRWMILALDGLMIDRRDTFAVGGVPWDGSIDVRDNAQSIAGLGLATGEFSRTAAILRSLSRYQDTLRKSPSFGRLPDRIVKGRPVYEGADVTPWFVRELYEQVVNTEDTTLLRDLYPVIIRSIDGTLRFHTDRYNLLTHGPRETWMKEIARGNRAVEVQVSWYFQQLIGRFVAAYLGDSAGAARWEDLPEKTARNFTLLFADTAAGTIADHLEADGSRSPDVRPNSMMCLEMLDAESMRHGVTRAAVGGLYTPDGIRTLASSDPRYASTPGTPGWKYDGPAWSWLAGPFSYALTRYDRQDVSYTLTHSMAVRTLGRGMAGALPDILGTAAPEERASLTGMAEFIRSVYQDYLGVRVDMASGTIAIQPKLPQALSLVQFTAYAGSFPIEVEYRKNGEKTRVYMYAAGLPKELKVTLLWVMDSGDAWRGSFRLKGGTPAAIVLGDDDAVIYQGESRGDFEGKRKLKGFSRKAEAADLSPVP